MTLVVTSFVVLGVAVVVYFGLIAGFDLTALIIFTLIVLVGLLAVAVARKSNEGRVGPVQCPECDGVVSPNAPYCKHCGATL